MSASRLRADLVAIVAAAAMLSLVGCATFRGQEKIGAYVDDSSITTTVKARMVEDKAVDASAIGVETVNGNVTLSGYARNALEKSTAESVAMKIKGVKSVQNTIAVRP